MTKGERERRLTEPTPLVEQVRSTSTEVNDLRAPIPVLFQAHTLRIVT